MKKPLLLILTLCMLLNTYAQQKNRQNYLSFSAGLALPVEGFAANSLTNPSAGFARLGEHISLAWSTLASSQKIGFTASISGQLNPINLNSMLGQLKIANQMGGFSSTFPPAIPPPSTGISYNNWNFKSKSWLTATIQAGGYGEIPLGTNKNLKGFAKVTIGALYAKLPALQADASDDTSIVSISQSGASSIGFAYSLGTGIKYKLNQKLSFEGALSYLGTPALTYKNVSAKITQVKNPGAINASYSQSVSTGNVKQGFNLVNISVGLGLQL